MEAIRVRTRESPVVALLGARQVGKATLAEQVAAEWEGPTVVFDLEKTATREALSAMTGSARPCICCWAVRHGIW